MGFAFFYAKNEKGKKIKRNFKKALDFSQKMCIIMMLPIWHPYAGMAELTDALDSGSSESNFMEVQVLLPAPTRWFVKIIVFFFFRNQYSTYRNPVQSVCINSNIKPSPSNASLRRKVLRGMCISIHSLLIIIRLPYVSECFPANLREVTQIWR